MGVNKTLVYSSTNQLQRLFQIVDLGPGYLKIQVKPVPLCVTLGHDIS